MSDIINTSVVALAALLHATLQLGLSCLTLLYHESTGRHITKKTKHLIGSFTSGAGVMIVLLLGASCFIVDYLLSDPFSPKILCTIVGLLIALALVMCFFYYRHGNSTELWLPKPFARFVDHRAKVTSSDTEAFSLGILCIFAELPIAIVPLILAANNILDSSTDIQLLLVALYVLITIAPLLIFRLAIRTGRTAVDIQKWRLHHKNFLRFISGISFLALAAFIIVFKVTI